MGIAMKQVLAKRHATNWPILNCVTDLLTVCWIVLQVGGALLCYLPTLS